MVQEYLLCAEQIDVLPLGPGETTSRLSATQYVDIAGQKIAYFTSDNGVGKAFIVPGIVRGKPYETETGKTAVKVVPITDESLQKTILKALGCNREYASFWDNGQQTKRVLSSFKKEPIS